MFAMSNPLIFHFSFVRVVKKKKSKVKSLFSLRPNWIADFVFSERSNLFSNCIIALFDHRTSLNKTIFILEKKYFYFTLNCLFVFRVTDSHNISLNDRRSVLASWVVR